jgi:hypothetical protein
MKHGTSVGLLGLLGLALVAACSSGSGTSSASPSNATSLGGSEKLKTCKSPKSPGKCEACAAAECSAESAIGLGSDPNAFGGACADYYQCKCDCLASDDACNAACTKTKACEDAFASVQSCTKASCTTECGTVTITDAGSD